MAPAAAAVAAACPAALLCSSSPRSRRPRRRVCSFRCAAGPNARHSTLVSSSVSQLAAAQTRALSTLIFPGRHARTSHRFMLLRRQSKNFDLANRSLYHQLASVTSAVRSDVTISVPIQKSKSCCAAAGHPRIRQLYGRPHCSQHQAEVASSTVDDDGACELVSGSDLVIGEGDDSVRAYLFKAVKNNNGTGILLLSDIFGFEDSATRDFAYRVACNGYIVLVPDMFRGNPWKRNVPFVANDDNILQWLAEQAPERVSGDIDACTRWLVDEFKAAGVSKKLGVVGFCYGGGRLVETLARDADKCFSAGVCFYGCPMDASLGDRIAAPVLFVCGDGDPYCPVETVRELERRARGARAAVYAGRGHGFAHRPQSVEEDADAENAFNAMRGWLQDHLLA